MPPLDHPRHEIVAQELAKGETQRAAYINAGYRGDNPRAADASASRLLTKANVKNRVSELQEQAAMTVKITIEGQLAKLEEVLQESRLLKQCSAAIAAIREQSELAGLKVNKTELKSVRTFEDMSDEELHAFVYGNKDVQ
jgi:Terminase small subunit